jgi:hypothetical protein
MDDEDRVVWVKLDAVFGNVISVPVDPAELHGRSKLAPLSNIQQDKENKGEVSRHVANLR